jgi:transposase-like protein/IS1 family transposase
MKPKEPQTLQEAIVYFADPERAFEYTKRLRWPDGKVTCPRCGSEKNSFINTRRLWFCYGCQKQFTLKVGTIFEDSALGLDKWMTAVWMLVNCKNGISSYEIARGLGITQKSAWFMLQRIRKALQESSFMKMGGSGSEVEVDETFIGGKNRNRHWNKRTSGTGGEGKETVVGAVERNGNVVARVIAHADTETLNSFIREAVSEKVSLIATDDYPGYSKLKKHGTVRHSAGQYVNGAVHSNDRWLLVFAETGHHGKFPQSQPKIFAAVCCRV